MLVPGPALTPEARLSLLVDRRTGVVVEQKPFIQPFERRLAAAELRGLGGDGVDFTPPSGQHVLLDSEVDVARLEARLAYWQRVGGERLEPTRQVRLEASSLDDDSRLPRRRLLRYGPHGLHEYRGKFFPQLVRALINAAGLEPGDLVLDPMCGSGTSMVEARALGMRALGSDLNPLSVHLARTKAALVSADPERLARATRRVLARLGADPPARPGWADSDRDYLERWFDPLALDDVAAIQGAVADEKDPNLRDVFVCCLSNVLRRVSWQKPEDLRVRKQVEPYERGEARRAFVEELSARIERLVPYLAVMGEHGEGPPAQVREGDARRVDSTFRRHVGACDVLVTSPPYAMALPYIDTDRLSLSVLGLLPRVGHRTREGDMVGNREITERRRTVLWEEYEARRKLLPARATRLIDALARSNHGDEVGFRRRNLPALLARYFLDMRDVMHSARRMMRDGAPGFWVVGNNSTEVRGDRVEIPTDEILFELAGSVGWKQHDLVDMELLPSRDIFRRNRGSCERILSLRAGLERRAVYGGAAAQESTEWDFHGADTQPHLHGLHPWPARFIPQIPRRAIAQWADEGQVVLDPFAGGGTTLLEASIAGRPSIGVDNNAVAHLVAMAKTQTYSESHVRALRRLGERIQRGEASELEPLAPEYKNREHWFSDAAVEDLGRLRAAVDRLPTVPRRLALAVFSAILLRASRQDSDTRYARVEREYTPGRAFRWYARRLADALTRLESLSGKPRAPVRAHLADGRGLPMVDDESVDLIVTSPPYLNAYDYHKYHRHRLHWVGGDVAMARDQEIGKHDTFTRPGADPEPYFRDMRECIGAWARVLRRGGRALIVVGDAIVSGRPVAVGDGLCEALDAAGLRLEGRWLRNIQSGRKSFNQRARIDREHVILARSSG